MCWVVFADAQKVTNQSYIYRHLIADNEDPVALLLKDQINNKEANRQER